MNKWRLLIISGTLALLIVSTIVAAFFLIPISKHAFIAALNDKFELLKNTESPKIIIVGGSSSAFGIDSGIIDKEFNYNVVNTALLGGLGLRYSSEFVKTNLHEGDIVIVVPEYLHLNGTVYKDTFNKAIVEFPQSIKYVSLIQDPISLSHILLNIQKRARKFLGLSRPIKNYIYDRSSFNRYGDIVAHLNAVPNRKPKNFMWNYEDVNIKTIKTLNDFHNYSINEGVQVFMTFSPCTRAAEAGDKNGQEWVKELSEQISMPIISTPDRYCFPLDHFWDSEHHLNAKGRQERTKRLVEDLKAALNENDN